MTRAGGGAPASPGPGRGPMAAGPVVAKARSFGPSIKRLIGLLFSYRTSMSVVVLSIIGSVILTAFAPRVLGDATNIIFDGVVGKMLPAGTTKAQAVEGLRERGNGTLADMVNSMNVTPGVGIDFGDVGRVLLIVLALYIGSSLLSWLARICSTSSSSEPSSICAQRSRPRSTGSH